MIGVDLIGQIRRAYFEQHRPIKEIVRTLSVSRATVRKVIAIAHVLIPGGVGIGQELAWLRKFDSGIAS